MGWMGVVGFGRTGLDSPCEKLYAEQAFVLVIRRRDVPEPAQKLLRAFVVRARV
jgi:hypothetical protein